MHTQSILPSIARMQPGDHYCGIFRTDEEQLAIIIDFIREGVARNERILYIVNLQSAEELLGKLATAGIDGNALVASGQLEIVSARESYLQDGQFDPDRMMKSLREATDRAIADGYTALRGTGEMTWALAGEPGSERLVEYESMVNHFVTSSKFYGLCQYDRRRFDSEMLLDILHTHPSVLFGKDGFDNSKMYYVPPDAFMERDRQSATLNTWLRNLSLQRA